MPRKARQKSRTGIYHIIYRGANRQEIFHDNEDRLQFLQTLEKYSSLYKVKIYAWCLMSNHVHLLMKEENEDISITIKRIAVSFVKYYHLKYNTTGHLFEDRFKSENVETVDYLLTVVRYIHQNPLKARIVRTLDEWEWNSCRAYYQLTSVTRLVDCNLILNMFGEDRAVAIERFKEFNETVNDDRCLEDYDSDRKRLTDDEARVVIKGLLGKVEIAQVKSLAREKRDPILRRLKGVEGLSQRQMARILGVSQTLIYRA
ncbi:transposase [Anaerobacillus sp. 1_MG-2023]|uniref:transposase n=1 Tax=Anaerobacillus sp. 1_MG-2023 TaxID=3062655 RepID=UPI0026E1ECB0|nr:transposase [Anaerobacillus sp. 1_MG-2023]MDO6657858.1 transposase [Anaerobacillus sp. 1_MG-2023]